MNGRPIESFAPAANESDVDVYREDREARSAQSRAMSPTPVAAAAAGYGGVLLGRVTGLKGPGVPLVDYVANPAGIPLIARSIVPLDDTHAGSEVVLMFDGGDLQRPIILGIVQSPEHETAAPLPAASKPPEAHVDGRRVVLDAEQEIVLRCGEASITLTCAGKIIIKGNYLLSRSAGVNKIQGGSIQLN